MMMLTFTGSLIENPPLRDLYDFWKLPQDADGLVPNHSEEREIWTSIGVRP